MSRLERADEAMANTDTARHEWEDAVASGFVVVAIGPDAGPLTCAYGPYADRLTAMRMVDPLREELHSPLLPFFFLVMPLMHDRHAVDDATPS